MVCLFKWYLKNLLRKEYRTGVHLLAGILLMLPLITVLLVVSRNFLFPMEYYLSAQWRSVVCGGRVCVCGMLAVLAALSSPHFL